MAEQETSAIINKCLVQTQTSAEVPLFQWEEAEIQNIHKALAAPACWEMGAVVGWVHLHRAREMYNNLKFPHFLPCCLR